MEWHILYLEGNKINSRKHKSNRFGENIDFKFQNAFKMFINRTGHYRVSIDRVN